MSENDDSDNRSLVSAGHRNLGLVAAANPLVTRGLRDLVKAASLEVSESVPPDPCDALLYDIRGTKWYLQEKYDRAIKNFDKAIRLDPESAYTYLHRGQAWLGKKDYDKAIGDFDEAIRLNPQSAVFYHQRGLARVNKKKYAEAITDYEEAIRLGLESVTTELAQVRGELKRVMNMGKP